MEKIVLVLTLKDSHDVKSYSCRSGSKDGTIVVTEAPRRLRQRHCRDISSRKARLRHIKWLFLEEGRRDGTWSKENSNLEKRKKTRQTKTVE